MGEINNNRIKPKEHPVKQSFIAVEGHLHHIEKKINYNRELLEEILHSRQSVIHILTFSVTMQLAIYAFSFEIVQSEFKAIQGAVWSTAGIFGGILFQATMLLCFYSVFALLGMTFSTLFKPIKRN